MYTTGEGVPQDYAEALTWHRTAAQHGHAMSQLYLGSMYAEGQGVPEDHVEAAKWYRLAADQAVAVAQLNLGVKCAEGQGVPRDDVAAANWFQKAAEHGNATAQVNLGVMYANGRGVPENYAEAVKWWRLAADQGNATALSLITKVKGRSIWSVLFSMLAMIAFVWVIAVNMSDLTWRLVVGIVGTIICLVLPGGLVSVSWLCSPRYREKWRAYRRGGPFP